MADRVTCDDCGKGFYWDRITRNGCFCRACRVERRRDYMREYMQEYRDALRGKPKPKRCSVCRCKFTPARSDAKYCSAKCKQAAYRKRHVSSR